VEIHVHLPPPDQGVLATILERLDTIMATQAEEVARLNSLLALVDKVGTEIDGALTEIQQLKDIVANIPNADPALTAAVDALQTRLQGLDLKIPDAPPAV
jgi:hypothetical protein